jgi:hypothetical protein
MALRISRFYAGIYLVKVLEELYAGKSRLLRTPVTLSVLSCSPCNDLENNDESCLTSPTLPSLEEGLLD